MGLLRVRLRRAQTLIGIVRRACGYSYMGCCRVNVGMRGDAFVDALRNEPLTLLPCPIRRHLLAHSLLSQLVLLTTNRLGSMHGIHVHAICFLCFGRATSQPFPLVICAVTFLSGAAILSVNWGQCRTRLTGPAGGLGLIMSKTLCSHILLRLLAQTSG